MTFPCPHCAQPTFTTPPHVCADTDHWTRAERDTYRAQLRRRYPWIKLI